VADSTKEEDILNVVGSICDKVVLVNGVKKSMLVNRTLAAEKN